MSVAKNSKCNLSTANVSRCRSHYTEALSQTGVSRGKSTPVFWPSAPAVSQSTDFYQQGNRQRENPFTDSRASQGYAMILLLGIMPLIVTLCFGVFMFSMSLNYWDRSHFLCQKELLQLQKHLGRGLTRLLNLNSLATSLRKRKAVAVATKELALARGDMATALAEEIKIQMIIVKQRLLHMQQLAILSALRSLASSSTSLVKMEILRVHPDTQIKADIYEPPVIADPTGDLAPVYKLKEPFEDLQRMTVSWKMSFDRSPIPEVSRFFGIPIRLHGICATSIFREENQWTAGLTAAK